MKLTEQELQKYYRYALALTNKSDEAFDLVHDAYLKVCKKTFIRKDSYMIVSIRNNYFNRLKKMGSNYENLEEHLKKINIYVQEEMESKIDLEKILSTLTPEEREILYLVEVMGFTFKEVRELKKKSIGTLLSKAHRAKSKLKKKGSFYASR